MNKENIDMLLIHILPKDLTEIIFDFFTYFCDTCNKKQRFCYDCFYYICNCECEKECNHCKISICNCKDIVYKICECCENYLCEVCLETDNNGELV